jgi:hypothetical protein
MKRIAALLGALALFAMTAPAVVAAPGPTGDEGLIGASNMTNSNALPGMLNAMSVNNLNGRLGMGCAVHITNGVADPGTCP